MLIPILTYFAIVTDIRVYNTRFYLKGISDFII